MPKLKAHELLKQLKDKTKKHPKTIICLHPDGRRFAAEEVRDHPPDASMGFDITVAVKLPGQSAYELVGQDCDFEIEDD